MLYTQVVGDKIVVSKDKMVVLPSNDNTKKLVELNNSREKLREYIKKSTKQRDENYSDLELKTCKLLGSTATSLMIFGGVDAALFISCLTHLQPRINPIGLLVVSNLALGTVLFNNIRQEIKLNRERKKINVQFSKIKEVVDKEIYRLSEEELDTTDDMLSYVKIKSL